MRTVLNKILCLKVAVRKPAPNRMALFLRMAKLFSKPTWRRALPVVPVVTLALLLSGCELAQEKSSLAQRASDALVEVGASPLLMRCLTHDLEGHLTEKDTDAFYEDLASEPEVSDVSLNRASLGVKAVKERLTSRAPGCRSSLISRGRYTRGETDRMLRHVGDRGYRAPRLFLEG